MLRRTGTAGGRGRRLGVAAFATAATVALGGCGAVEAGSAALVGGTAISQRALESRATDYLDSLTATQRSQVQSRLSTVQGAILNEMVLEDLVGHAATQAGVSVPASDVSAAVQAAVASSGDQLQSQLAQSYLTRDDLPDLLRVNLQVYAIGRQGATTDLTDQQAAQRAIAYITSPDRDLSVKVNPRYGTWQGVSLQPSNGSLSTVGAGESQDTSAGNSGSAEGNVG